MKYILNEYKKFILTEAAYVLPNEITKSLNAYLKLINNYSKEDLDKISDQLELYKKNAQTNYDGAEVNLRSLGQDAIKKVKEENKAIVDYLTQAEQQLAQTKQKRELLITNIKRIKKATSDIAKVFNSWNLSKSKLEKTIFSKNLTKIFNEVINQSNLSSLPTKIITSTDILDPNKNKNQLELSNNLEPIFQNINQISNTLNTELEDAAISLEKVLKDAKEYQYPETQNSLKNTAAKDWDALVKNAAKSERPEQALANVWKNYYNVEWGDKAKNIQKLGSIFTQELLALSFDANLNPFIYFLQQTLVYKNPQELNITYNNYAAIHNAFVKDYISEDDLRGTGFLGYGNLLFNADLYNQNANDILSYLKFQQLIKDKYASNQASEYFKNETLKALYGKNSKSFIYHLFNKNKSVFDAEDSKVTDKNLQTMQLKSLTEIEKEFKACFGYSAQGDISKAKWTTSTGTDIVAKLHKQDAIINALKYLSTVYPSTDMDTLLSQYKETSQDNSYNIGYNQQFNKLFSNYSISAKNAKTVAEDIIKAAKLTKI